MVDDEDAISDGSNIGCIQLDIHLVRIMGPATKSWSGHKVAQIPENEAVSEKSKKLGSHRVGYSIFCLRRAIANLLYRLPKSWWKSEEPCS